MEKLKYIYVAADTSFKLPWGGNKKGFTQVQLHNGRNFISEWHRSKLQEAGFYHQYIDNFRIM